jgi:hypothetical protein
VEQVQSEWSMTETSLCVCQIAETFAKIATDLTKTKIKKIENNATVKSAAVCDCSWYLVFSFRPIRKLEML